MGYVRPAITEMCSECMSEVTLLWDPDKEGYAAYCPYCGEELMLCDACRHADDNPHGYCDFTWIDKANTVGTCFRRLMKDAEKAKRKKEEFEEGCK